MSITDDSDAALLALEQRLADAVRTADLGFLHGIWDDDFFYTGVRGETKNKAQVLAEIQSGTLQFDVMRFDDIRIRRYQNSAVVTGLATAEGSSPAGSIKGAFRYTRVYVRRPQGWRIVTFQGTPLDAT
jgi:ketosteroid isomerase-like protein